MPTFGRRRQDRLAQRSTNMILALCIALSVLNIWISYKAITTMDQVATFAFDAYQLGKAVRKPNYAPESNEHREYSR